jgi:hypothetical protein
MIFAKHAKPVYWGAGAIAKIILREILHEGHFTKILSADIFAFTVLVYHAQILWSFVYTSSDFHCAVLLFSELGS